MWIDEGFEVRGGVGSGIETGARFVVVGGVEIGREVDEVFCTVSVDWYKEFQNTYVDV